MKFVRAFVALGAISTSQIAAANPIAADSVSLEQRKSSVAAPSVSFADEITKYLQLGQVMSACDPTDPECNEAQTKRSLEPRVGQANCPAGSNYWYSFCSASYLVRVVCHSDAEGMVGSYIFCPENEVCIQRGSYALRRARCYPIVDLVSWYTPDNGQVTGTELIHARDRAQTASLVNNYYDANDHLIQVFRTDFVTSPGGVDEGEIFQANTAESKPVNWEKVANLEVSVRTGGSGHVRVVSFIDAGF